MANTIRPKALKDTTETYQHPPKILSAAQHRHRVQMDMRPLFLERKMQFLVGHTILPGYSRSEFAGAVDTMEVIGDVIVTKFWKKIPSGAVRSGTRFSVYKASWDEDNGIIYVGGPNNNPFAKDLSCRPLIGGRGRVFDNESSPVNWETGMIVDMQLEAAARNPLLQADKFTLSDFLLGYEPDHPPYFTDTHWLQQDVLHELRHSHIKGSHLLHAGVEGVIVDVDDGRDSISGTARVIIKDATETEFEVEFPSFIRLFELRPGMEVSETQHLGELALPNAETLESWEQLASLAAPIELGTLLERQWASRYTVQVVYSHGQKRHVYCIPYEYVSTEDAKRSIVRLRDVASRLGRVVYDNEDPDVVLDSTDGQAKIDVINTNGDPEMLYGSYRGVRYDFATSRPGWESFFESLPAPE